MNKQITITVKRLREYRAAETEAAQLRAKLAQVQKLVGEV